MLSVGQSSSNARVFWPNNAGMQDRPGNELVVLQHRDLLSRDAAVRQKLLAAVSQVMHVPQRKLLLWIQCGLAWTLMKHVLQAYGPHGLGILTVAGVPSLLELRKALLPLSAQIVVCAHLASTACAPTSTKPANASALECCCSLLQVSPQTRCQWESIRLALYPCSPLHDGLGAGSCGTDMRIYCTRMLLVIMCNLVASRSCRKL